MDYVYVATGGISVYGCSACKSKSVYQTKYVVGQLVYSVPQARLGVLERLAIKEVKVFPTLTAPLSAGGWMQGNTPLYTDTFNSLYNEDDLCDLATAQALIRSFNDWRTAQLQWIAQHC